MQKPLTRGQKLLAYSALGMVLLWTLFGGFVIWLLLTKPMD